MALRMLLLRIGLLAGCGTTAGTLWRLWATNAADPVSAVIRAIIAGLAVVIITLLICGVIDKFGDAPGE